MQGEFVPKPKHKTLRRYVLTAAEVKFCVLIFSKSTSIGEAYQQTMLRPGQVMEIDNASKSGSRLLKRDSIREYLRELQFDAMAAARVTAERIIKALAAIAFSDCRRLYKKGSEGELLYPDQWPDDIIAAIDGVSQDDLMGTVIDVDGEKKMGVKRRKRSVKLASKTQALLALASIYKLMGSGASLPGSGEEDRPLTIVQGDIDAEEHE